MFLLRLSTLLFLYIPQFPAHCHEYAGENITITLLFFFFLLFPFPFPFFHSFFNFQYTIPTTIDGAYLSFYQTLCI
jgi:hypothetical protein